MRTACKIFALAALLLTLFGCSMETFLERGDYFFVDHKGAEMPVWIRGKKASGIVLIWIHGGPGGSAFNTVSREPAFVEVLEAEIAVAYYDQRASGNLAVPGLT